MASKLQEGWVVVPQVRTMRETVYGVKTHYVHDGEGEPVIMLHGGGPGAGGEANWRNTIPALAPYFHAIGLDQLGYGPTDRPRIEYTFQGLVEHLAGFIDAMTFDHVRLIGNSQGAYVAVKYALDHPARVKQVACVSTGTLATAMGIKERGQAVELPRFDGTKESLRRFLEVIVNDPNGITDELLDARYATAMMPGGPEARESLNRFRKLLQEDPDQRQVYDVGARLPLLTVPWCMIWGTADRSAPLEPLGTRMREIFPDVPFYVVEGAGHQVQNDKPEECNRILLEFFGVKEAVRA